MIVGSYFDGDTTDLARMQHDVYREALRVIVSSIYVHAENAADIIGVINRHQRSDGRDHRALQMAHDILAAAWRYQTEPPDLFAEKPGQSTHDWLTWLRAECHSWHFAPEIVQLFLMIFENQNNEDGYRAEGTLSRRLLRRFSGIPWHDRYLALLAQG